MKTPPSTTPLSFTSPLTPPSSSSSSTFIHSPPFKKPSHPYHSNPPTTPFKTAYGCKVKLPLITPPDQGRTKQSFKDECDINAIMARYQKTGILDFAEKHEPQYGDCTGVEFQQGMEIVARARSMFEDLPATVRARFENDPRQMLDFVQHEKNREEAIALGLVRPMTAQAPTPPDSPKPPAGAPGEAPKGPKQGSDGKPTPPPGQFSYLM